MKAVIICPAHRAEVANLAQQSPLATVSICGKPFLFYWLEYLITKGASEIIVLASDRPEQVRAAVGDGARWGIRVEVAPECRELTVREARKKHRRASDTGWIDEPNDIVLADCLPGYREINLFRSYAEFFSAVEKVSPLDNQLHNIGWREIAPGVWTGLRSHISEKAVLNAPCWIADHSIIGNGAVIGPNARIESHVVVDAVAHITNSYIGEATYVGRYTALSDVVATGDTISNWKHNFEAKIADKFLLSPLNWRTERLIGRLIGRLLALVVFAATTPWALVWALSHIGSRRNLVSVHTALLAGQNRCVEYAELNDSNPLLRRWPQLWNVFRGEFTWLGNRPLSEREAETLTNEFERLWLEAPTGLLSFADAIGCIDEFSDTACAHSSFYSAQHHAMAKTPIVFRAFWNLLTHRDDNTFVAVKTEQSPLKQGLSTPNSGAFHVPYSR